MIAFVTLRKIKHKVVFYTILFLVFYTSIAFTDDQLVIEIDNPKFSEKGLDDKVYEIKAEKGFKSNDQLELITVEGKFKTDKGTWIYLKANKGNFLQSLNFLSLEGDIIFYTEENEILSSDHATFDIKKDVIVFIDNVSHTKNDLRILANSSRAIKNLNIITYEGNVSTEFQLNNTLSKLLISFLVIFIFCINNGTAKELKITSEKLEIDRGKKLSIFTGNVYAKQEDMEIWSEKLIVKYTENEEQIDEVKAESKVKIIRDNMVATSEIGYYWPQNNELNLVHNVKVNENGNIVKCDELFLDLENP